MKTKQTNRIALSVYFFLSGLCFATWASRIPTLKEFFNLNDAQLGSILLVMPIAALIGTVSSGWLISKFNNRDLLLFSFLFFAFALLGISLVQSTFLLIIVLAIFSICMRVLNIAMNAQSITLQSLFDKKIIGSFHGIWSLGGVIGVLFSTIMVEFRVNIKNHFLIVALITIIAVMAAYKNTLTKDKSTTGNKLIIGKPDPFIFYLGLLIFFAALCEGGMFDWSGIYFKEVVKEEVFTYGYLIFMIFMASSRFFLDQILDKIGMPKLYIISGLLISTGTLTTILLPKFWTALIGFCLVGIGVSAIFPMTYILAGKSKKYSPGMAISIIGTYAIVGMFIGPPLIGYLSHNFGLKKAFFTLVFCGAMFIPISQLFFKTQKDNL
ncbi:MFS transporter [Winogradskyella endarachnes]|uniref:MFS transporter n=1 Tax=Winogradskyella endarachnes TaxID=2681965 RepID=A0A6L6U9S1_9FLAO|nr:MFS transporter [Winogradskyella endarachnes]MUU79080.1 MFS transporter [Winogradskyella endarachnes]